MVTEPFDTVGADFLANQSIESTLQHRCDDYVSAGAHHTRGSRFLFHDSSLGKPGRVYPGNPVNPPLTGTGCRAQASSTLTLTQHSNQMYQVAGTILIEVVRSH